MLCLLILDLSYDMAPTKYSRLRSPVSSEDKYTDEQFKQPPPKFPTRSIIIAIFLFLLGLAMLTLGVLLLTGIIESKFWDRCYPLLFLGTIVFIPGAYHVRIAYCAWRGYHGYSYDDIPTID